MRDGMQGQVLHAEPLLPELTGEEFLFPDCIPREEWGEAVRIGPRGEHIPVLHE